MFCARLVLPSGAVRKKIAATQVACLFTSSINNMLYRFRHKAAICSVNPQKWKHKLFTDLYSENGTLRWNKFCFHDYEDAWMHHTSPGATTSSNNWADPAGWRTTLYLGIFKLFSTRMWKRETKEVSFDNYHVAQIHDVKQCRIIAFVLSKVRCVRLFVWFTWLLGMIPSVKCRSGLSRLVRFLQWFVFNVLWSERCICCLRRC